MSAMEPSAAAEPSVSHEAVYNAVVRALPRAIWAINTRVTRLEERLPRPIADELTPIKEKLAEISGRLQGIEARAREIAAPAARGR
jgi:hypothetical protein